MKTANKLIAIALIAVVSCTTLTATASAAWVKNNKGTVWQNADGSYAKSKWMTMKNGNKYYIRADGTRATGMLSMKNKTGGKDYYYFNEKGIMQTGWQSVKGSVYYFKADGKAATTMQVIGNNAYKFNAQGIWDGKVYSKDGKKDVTETVNVTELVPVAASADRSAEYGKVKKISGERPETVTINGLTYNTSANNIVIYGGEGKPGGSGTPVFPEGNDYTEVYINIANCTDDDLECLKYFSNLEKLELVTCTKEQMLDQKNVFQVGATGGFQRVSYITNLDFCYYMPKLKYVSIYNTPYLTDVSGLSVCKNLQELRFASCGMKSLDGLEKLTRIKKIYANNTRLENLDGLKNCTNLQIVDVANAYLTDISGLSNKSKLKQVDLNVNRRLTDISPLATCNNLKSVMLTDCNGIMDWSPLLNIQTLEKVSMYRASKKSNAQQIHDTLNGNGIGYGIFDSLIYDSASDGLPHNLDTINCDEYWDREKYSTDVYGTNYPCKCSYCENWRKTGGNWTGVKGAIQAQVDLGTYQE